MRKISCLLLTVCLFLSCNKLRDFIPLPPAPQFNKVYGGSGGEEVHSIVASLDGGYVMAGYTSSNDGDVSGNHGSIDAWVVKLDKNGNIIWQKALGGTDQDVAYAISASLDGYVIAGITLSNDGDVIGYHGGADAWIVKLDIEGNKVWQKALGGSSYDRANSIIATLDGYAITGGTHSTNGDVSGKQNGELDGWVVKLNKEGTIIWQKAFGFGESSVWDYAFSITATLNGGYVIAGTTNYFPAGITNNNVGNVDGSHGGTDAWVVKLDKNGNIQWQKVLGGSGDDGASSIIQSIYGNYVMAGSTYSNDGDVSGNHGYVDAWVMTLKDQ